MRSRRENSPKPVVRTWSSLLLALAVLVQALWTPGHLFAEHHYEPALLAAEHEAAGIEGAGHHRRPHAAHSGDSHDHSHLHSHSNAHSHANEHHRHDDHHKHHDHGHGDPVIEHLLALLRGDTDDTWSPAPHAVQHAAGDVFALPHRLMERAWAHPPRDVARRTAGPRAPPLA